MTIRKLITSDKTTEDVEDLNVLPVTWCFYLTNTFSSNTDKCFSSEMIPADSSDRRSALWPHRNQINYVINNCRHLHLNSYSNRKNRTVTTSLWHLSLNLVLLFFGTLGGAVQPPRVKRTCFINLSLGKFNLVHFWKETRPKKQLPHVKKCLFKLTTHIKSH